MLDNKIEIADVFQKSQLFVQFKLKLLNNNLLATPFNSCWRGKEEITSTQLTFTKLLTWGERFYFLTISFHFETPAIGKVSFKENTNGSMCGWSVDKCKLFDWLMFVKLQQTLNLISGFEWVRDVGWPPSQPVVSRSPLNPSPRTH